MADVVEDQELITKLLGVTSTQHPWAFFEGKAYKRMAGTDDAPFFLEYSTIELLDSRSIPGRAATYSKLDGAE